MQITLLDVCGEYYYFSFFEWINVSNNIEIVHEYPDLE